MRRGEEVTLIDNIIIMLNFSTLERFSYEESSFVDEKVNRINQSIRDSGNHYYF